MGEESAAKDAMLPSNHGCPLGQRGSTAAQALVHAKLLTTQKD